MEVAANIRRPEIIRLSDARGSFRAGCSVIEVSFSNPPFVEVEQICFKNNYTALLTVKMKSKDSQGETSEWHLLVSELKLMANPHFAGGSEDTFKLTKKHFLRDASRVCSLRLILQQPSPVWKEFSIEEIKIFKPLAQPSTPAVALPPWLTSCEEMSKKKVNGERAIKGVTSVEQLSSTLQQMWALAEKAGERQPSRPIGRYDIDGCYEINLLSYI